MEEKPVKHCAMKYSFGYNFRRPTRRISSKCIFALICLLNFVDCFIICEYCFEFLVHVELFSNFIHHCTCDTNVLIIIAGTVTCAIMQRLRRFGGQMCDLLGVRRFGGKM
jgi:hypothetical protein